VSDVIPGVAFGSGKKVQRNSVISVVVLCDKRAIISCDKRAIILCDKCRVTM
jgi:hypothetical protein